MCTYNSSFPLVQAYFAMGKRGFDQTFQTGLPAGQYCDLISNCRQKVTVDDTGSARLAPFSDNVPIVAFLVGQSTGWCVCVCVCCLLYTSPSPRDFG